jgi:5-formyltetrahydrofolate cyclo-ligase
MNDQPTDLAAFRRALRDEKIAARNALPAAFRQTADSTIRTHLATFLSLRPPGIIGFCWPIRGEVDCRPLIGQLLKIGWHAVMPVVVTPASAMQFRPWSPTVPMAQDPYGIPVPVPASGSSPLPNVLLLPLVAFDAAGFRLGYGGGYFDRTLAACQPRPLSIGVGYALSAVATIHPEAHDIALDAHVTEQGWHYPAAASADT